jgi:fructan beta-fructosidase
MKSKPTFPGLFGEKHRPQFHFSPKVNWINDPNGMVYYNGKYHLFYQYNPGDKVWGDMNWGHASSSDLIHWQHHNTALVSEADGLGYIFSGSTVVDWQNTSGLQQTEHPPLVALFTHCSRYDHQVQSLAFSVDGGESWQKYLHNPVIENPGIADFRDPKVIWHPSTNSWIMTLAAGDQIKLYRSLNLLTWHHISDFGKDSGAHGGLWECPDFFPLNVDGTTEQKWVLLVSINPGGPNNGSATQYFIGEFDGTHFVQQHTEILWLDYGPDCYAGVTFSDIPNQDGRRIMLAWMTNWSYAPHQPTAPWRGAMTFPRSITLRTTAQGLRLSTLPIAELVMLRQPKPIIVQNCRFHDVMALDNEQPIADCLEIHLTIDWSAYLNDEWILRFHNKQGEALLIDVQSSIKQLKIDRSKANFGLVQHTAFNGQIHAPLEQIAEKKLSLIILKDASSIEVFTQDGVCVLTTTYYVNQPLDRLEIQSGHPGIPLDIKSAHIYTLNSIWQKA